MPGHHTSLITKKLAPLSVSRDITFEKLLPYLTKPERINTGRSLHSVIKFMNSLTYFGRHLPTIMDKTKLLCVFTRMRVSCLKYVTWCVFLLQMHVIFILLPSIFTTVSMFAVLWKPSSFYVALSAAFWGSMVGIGYAMDGFIEARQEQPRLLYPRPGDSEWLPSRWRRQFVRWVLREKIPASEVTGVSFKGNHLWITLQKNAVTANYICVGTHWKGL